MSSALSPLMFYKDTRERKFTPKDFSIDVFVPRRFTTIFGPSTTWKIFRKQNEAVAFAKNHGDNLMAFAFQRSDGTRGFLAAHPSVFWWYDSRKNPSDRRTFEVIAENEPCKLYLDLEFDRSCNPGHDGVEMTSTFIQVLCSVLKREFNIDCDRSSVLDLDSTTDTKFSRHLIFQIPKTCFRNNYHAGSFVRMICHEIRIGCNSENGSCGISADVLKQLFVKDKKNNLNLFCDEGVYTKNRHFRLYQSTKWNKNAPLVVSAENMYKVMVGKEDAEEQLFLDSLVTYTVNCQDTILELSDVTCVSYSGKEENGKSSLSSNPIQSDMSLGNSPLPVVDKFIQELVYPGNIRKWFYFVESNRLDYDIVGNRYCHNIGRAHKSNNVKYVVDLKKGVYYQKCYDNDCVGYRSPESELPAKVLFLLDSEDIGFEEVADISDTDLTEVWESVNALLQEESQGCCANTEEEFPDFGLSDNEMLNSSMDLN